MGLFRRPKAESEPTERAFAMTQLGRVLSSTYVPLTGRDLTTADALRWAAAWACVRVLGQSASMLPLDVVRYVDGTRLPVEPVPPLIANPSGIVESDVWVQQVVSSMETAGNAWGVVTDADRRGYPTAIETLDPKCVRDPKVVDGVLTAHVDNKPMKRFPYGDLWHVPGVMVAAGSPLGLSTVEYASGAIDTALAAESFGAHFFTDGGHPSSIVYADQELTEDQAKQIKQAFLAATSGTSREPAVLGSGLKHEAIQVNPDDSQFIDLLRLEVENTCRFFGVPPSMVYGAVSGQNVTYANVAQADLAFLKHGLDPRLVRIERALSRLLPGGQTVKFNRDALLRADTASRYAQHAVALTNKFRTVNEVRRIEDERPFDDPMYDEPGLPGGADVAAHEAAPGDPAEDSSPQEQNS